MRTRLLSAMACAIAVAIAAPAGVAAPSVANTSNELEGLVRVKSRQFDAVHLLPKADFRGYTKVMLDPAQVAFARNWLRDVNRSETELSRRTTRQDADRIADEARAGFGESLANAFRNAGYAVVAAPGADVLRLSPRIVDLYVTAPARLTSSPGTRVYTANAGEGTLVLDFRDSTTGAVLGRATDRRTAGDRGSFDGQGNPSLSITSTISNRGDFTAMFGTWARSSVAVLEESKAGSPVAPDAGPAKD